MVATDHHLGYKEQDQLTGCDSFDSFEECLEHAHAKTCDFTLLGGDLFHEH